VELFLPIALMDVNIALILCYGAVVGFLSGLVGVGGGFLITPLLIFTGIPPIVAVSSGAAQMAGTAAGGSYLQWRDGNVDFRMGILLLLGGWFGGGAGVYLAKLLVRTGQFSNVVVFLYVILLGFIGASMLIESLRAVFRKPTQAAATNGQPAPASPMQKLFDRLPYRVSFPASRTESSVFVPLVLGVAVGILTSLMGVGGGFVMVPVMIYMLKMPTKVVVGTSLFQLLFTTAAVSIMQAGVNHSVDPFLTLLLIAGSIAGTGLGTRLGRRLPEEKLRLILALVVVAVAVKMALGLVFPPAELYDISPQIR
jgi:uncharacterized protein